MLQLPYSNDPSFTQEMELDDTVFSFHFYWISRESCWCFNMFDKDGNGLLFGKKIVLHFDLCKQFVQSNFPAGKFYAVDQSGNLKAIEKEDFTNGRLALIYLEEEDL